MEFYIESKNCVQPPENHFLLQWYVNSYSFWVFRKHRLAKESEKWNDLYHIQRILWERAQGWLGGSIQVERHPTRDPKTRGSNPVRSINKQWEVIALEQLTSHMTLNAGPQQQRPESSTITPPGMRWIQRTYKLHQGDILKKDFWSLTSRRHRSVYGPRSQGVGEAGLYLALHCHHQTDIALRCAAMGDILMFHYCGWQSHKTRVHNHNVWKRNLGF